MNWWCGHLIVFVNLTHIDWNLVKSCELMTLHNTERDWEWVREFYMNTFWENFTKKSVDSRRTCSFKVAQQVIFQVLYLIKVYSWNDIANKHHSLTFCTKRDSWTFCCFVLCKYFSYYLFLNIFTDLFFVGLFLIFLNIHKMRASYDCIFNDGQVINNNVWLSDAQLEL